MAILKVINSLHDWTTMNGSGSINETRTGIDLNYVSRGWRFDPADTGDVMWPAPAGSTLWIHMRLRTNSNDIAFDDDFLMQWRDEDANRVMRLRFKDSNTEILLEGDTTSTWAKTTLFGTYAEFDIKFTKNGTTDLTIDIYRNGIFRGTRTVANSGDKGLPVSMRLRQNDFEGTSVGTIWISEFVIADEQTIGWRIVENKPLARGVDQEWDNNTFALQRDGLEAGIHTDTDGERAAFGVSRFRNIPANATIDRTFVQTYAQRGASGLTKINHYWRYEDGTQEDAADHTLTTALEIYCDEWTTSPDTSVGWTNDELVNIHLGVRGRT